jgi:hypothetical protein
VPHPNVALFATLEPALSVAEGVGFHGRRRSKLHGRVAGLVFCDQSAVTVRFVAGLTSIQLALLSRSSTTGRATDGKYLFWVEFLFHHEPPRTKVGQKFRPGSHGGASAPS